MKTCILVMRRPVSLSCTALLWFSSSELALRMMGTAPSPAAVMFHMRLPGHMIFRRMIVLGSVSLSSLFLVVVVSVLASKVGDSTNPPPASAYFSQATIILTKTVSLNSDSCGEDQFLAVPSGFDVTYCFTVKNSGTLTLSHHELVDNKLGVIIDESFSLFPGNTHVVTASVNITVSTVNTATWTAYNPGPTDVVSGTDSAQVDVVPAALITVTPQSLFTLQGPNEQTTFTIALGNVGDADLLWKAYEEPSPSGRVGMPAVTPSPPDTVAPVEMVRSEGECSKYRNYVGPEPPGYAKWCLDASFFNGRNSSRSNRAPSDIAYAHDVGFISDNFFWHYLNDFPGQIVVGQQPDLISGYDFDVIGRILYGLKFETKELGTVSLSDGSFEPIGASVPISTGEELVGLTIHPVTGEAYVATTDSQVGRLYSIDLSTGALTFIGGDSEMPFPIDIAINPEGEMYALDISTDSIYRIDVRTGDATLIGPTGVDANFSQGMDFDNYDGTLYAWIYEGGGLNQFGTIDLKTGALTALAIDDPTGEFEGATKTPLVDSCQTGFNTPWISVTPNSGTIGPSTSQQITVTVDSTNLPAGVYGGVVCFESNDFFSAVVRVPITMEIESFASIELRKTVGLQPNTCSDTNLIAVRAGTRVYYCYQITNNGSVPFTRHDLVDSQLPSPVLSHLSALLQPGISLQPIVGVFITETVVNTATWTAYNPGPTDLVEDTDTAKVLVSQSAVFLPYLNKP